MNELEALLREQLHKAADPIEVPVDEVAVLDAGRRARTARTIKWVVVGLALLAAASAAVFALWQGGLNEERRAVPDPLQTPTVEPVTPTPSGGSETSAPETSASATPSGAPSSAPTPSGSPTRTPGTQSTATQPPAGPLGAPATLDQAYRDGTGKVRVQSDGGGVRFTGLDAGATGSATLASPRGGIVATSAGVPGPGWVLAVLPSEAAWATFVDTAGTSTEAAMIPVPGTDLLAVGTKQGRTEANPRLVWGTTDGRVFTSDGRTLPSATFESLWGSPSTHFVDDRWALSGRSMANEGFTVQMSRLDTSLLAITSIGGKDADSIEFVLSLPAGADPASLTWDLRQDTTIAIARETATLPDGRILVHEAFRAPRITDQWNASTLPTATYTNAAGQRVTAPVWRP